MPDVRIYQTDDGGEIDFVNGAPTMAAGIESAAYLSLFGGNERDAGNVSTEKLQWWGNFGEQLPERTYRSETQHLLTSIVAIPANMRRVQDAVTRDLAWMVTSGVVDSVDALVTMPRVRGIHIELAFVVGNETYSVGLDADWEA